MKKFKNILAICVIANGLTPFIANSQELNESFTVEGDYTPIIHLQERINKSPFKYESKLPSTNLNYVSNGVPINVEDDIFALPVTGWRKDRLITRHKGYVDFGIGSYLNIVGSAGYRVIDTEKTKVGLWLQHNSTSGFTAYEYDWSKWYNTEQLPTDAKKFRSDTRLTLYGSHRFDAGQLEANLSYRFGRFNYYGVTQDYINNFGDIPIQNLNDVQFVAGWQGVQEGVEKLNYGVNFGYRYFGYHRNFSDDRTRNTQKENHFTLGADMSLPWSNGSCIGLNVTGDMILYTGLQNLGLVDTMEDYGKVSLTPYYRFAKNNINISAGIKLDLTFNAKKEYYSCNLEQKYALLHVSPQVKIDWKGQNVGIWLHLLGGTELNTLANNSQLDYYQAPQMQGTIPMYSPLDGRLGVSVGRFAGFSAEVLFDYKIVNNVNFGGLYMNFDKPYMMESGSFVHKSDASMDIHGWRAGLGLRYEMSDLFEIEGKGYYSPQDAERGYFNGYDRPRWVLDSKIVVKPWKTLKVGIEYQYRGVRNLYDFTLESAGVTHRPNVDIHACRLPDVTLLNLSASYSLIDDRLNIWARANNVLGSASSLNPSLPNEGFNFMAGIGFNF